MNAVTHNPAFEKIAAVVHGLVSLQSVDAQDIQHATGGRTEGGWEGAVPCIRTKA